MRRKAFYEAPESEILELGLEMDLLTGSEYGDGGKPGKDLNELDELEF